MSPTRLTVREIRLLANGLSDSARHGGFLRLTAIVASVLVLQFATALVVSVIVFGATIAETDMSAWLLGLVNALSFGIVILCTWRPAPPCLLRSLVRTFPIQGIAALVAAVTLTMAGAHFVGSEINRLAATIVPVPPSLRWIHETSSATTAVEFVIVFGAVAASTEELLFRGILIERLLPRRSVAGTIWFSAALFGMAHLDPWSFVSTLLVGVYLGYLYVTTRSIVLCVVGHAVINLMYGSAVPEYVVAADGASLQPEGATYVGIAMVAVGVFLTVKISVRYRRGDTAT